MTVLNLPMSELGHLRHCTQAQLQLLDPRAAISAAAYRRKRQDGFRPKKPICKGASRDAASIAASARHPPLALNLTASKNIALWGSAATIPAIFTISGANHVDGTPPVLAPRAKLV